jgi:hypothetical protein
MTDAQVYQLLKATLDVLHAKVPKEQLSEYASKMPGLMEKAFADSWHPQPAQSLRTRLQGEEIKSLSFLQELLRELAQAGL